MEEQAEALKQRILHWQERVRGGYSVPTDLTSVIVAAFKQVRADALQEAEQAVVDGADHIDDAIMEIRKLSR